MVEIFQNQDGTAFADYETVPPQVERPRSLLRFAVPHAQRRQTVKSRNSKGMDHAMSAAAQHDVRVLASNRLDGFANRLALDTQAAVKLALGPCAFNAAAMQLAAAPGSKTKSSVGPAMWPNEPMKCSNAKCSTE